MLRILPPAAILLLNAIRSIAAVSTAYLGRGVQLEAIDQRPREISAVVYGERTEWRSTDQGREKVIVRDIIVSAVDANVPLGSVFQVDSQRYTIERTQGSASGRRRLTGRRTTHAEVTRPNYRGR